MHRPSAITLSIDFARLYLRLITSKVAGLLAASSCHGRVNTMIPSLSLHPFVRSSALPFRWLCLQEISQTQQLCALAATLVSTLQSADPRADQSPQALCSLLDLLAAALAESDSLLADGQLFIRHCLERADACLEQQSGKHCGGPPHEHGSSYEPV